MAINIVIRIIANSTVPQAGRQPLQRFQTTGLRVGAGVKVIV